MRLGVLKKVTIGQGYSTDISLDDCELQAMRTFVNNQWLTRLETIARNRCIDIGSREANQYHEIAGHFNHKQLWPKSERILGTDFVKWFSGTCFKKKIENELGCFDISDEESLGYPNFYWRICRPLSEKDVGPVHRDSWFWEINPNFPKPEYSFQRVKVWIPLYVERGLNGLLLEPFSHKRTDIKWVPEYRDGMMKPLILTGNDAMTLQLVNVENGQAIIFNDDLLHGGAINRGDSTRVSLEFTTFVRDSHAF